MRSSRFDKFWIVALAVIFLALASMIFIDSVQAGQEVGRASGFLKSALVLALGVSAVIWRRARGKTGEGLPAPEDFEEEL